MSEITVIGLGSMGSALARAFLEKDHQITIWNRTKSKADPLVKNGAKLASDLSSAIALSPVTLICLKDYKVTIDLLTDEDVRSNLAGRVVVQLTGGTPDEARKMGDLIKENGAEYLDGTISVYPPQIGSEEATILISGPKKIFRQCEKLLKVLAGQLKYIGEPIGAAAAHGLASGSVLFGAYLGALHTARICQAEGIDMQIMLNSLKTADLPTFNAAVLDMLARIENKNYDEPEATIETGAGGAEMLLEHARSAGINTDFPDFVFRILREGVKKEIQKKDMAALILT
jgi:3-hydroxyisobutyrate dehydrogenase-like beta-hydroxyacid dehydrogenase